LHSFPNPFCDCHGKSINRLRRWGKEEFVTQQPKKLLDRVRDAIRLKHYAYRTEDTYVSWIRQYILFHDKRHPGEMGAAEVEAFLTYLAQERHVSSSTQNQALSAVLFLYREVLRQPLDHVEVTWAQKPKRLPTVLSQEEANRVLSHLSGVHLLMGLAVHFPFHQTGCGQAGRFAAPPSFARKRITKSSASGSAESGCQ
jgi:integrase